MAPNASQQSRALVLRSRKCYLYIADNEVGYFEKASDSQLDDPLANPGNNEFTKYGAWYGRNGKPWCAIFVGWCAAQAQISTAVIPRTADVEDMYDFFHSQSRYYINNGSYTPQEGDLVFITWDGEPYGHIGIVYTVEGNYITVIDGNWGPKIDHRVLNKSDTSITGYASQNVPYIEHIWTGTAPDEYCSICGAHKQYSANY